MSRKGVDLLVRLMYILTMMYGHVSNENGVKKADLLTKVAVYKVAL